LKAANFCEHQFVFVDARKKDSPTAGAEIDCDV
jgi:hypothetical protein